MKSLKKFNRFVGIDLAGSEKRNTGVCILIGNKAKTEIVKKNREILDFVEKSKARIVAIDAPLFLPFGRKSIDKKSKVHLRECDRQLLKLRIKFFPITLGPMRMLTKRGIWLKSELEKRKIKVLETYPGAIYDLLKIERKEESIKKGLKKLGLRFKNKITRDELDSIACAYLAKLYKEKKTIGLGRKEEGFMYLPKV
ncbi:MAG: DUF429 domain-containing protein [Candidatus Micrarchaeia archaeon]|jgi:predicted nuclease with RNAse H fold